MNNIAPITHYIIVGGGSAGWISAAILSRVTAHLPCKITLIESPTISSVGVGEATIPSIIDLLRFLDIPQTEFIQATQATFKLGIKFTNWLTEDHSYWHPFGNIGQAIDGLSFYQHWLGAKQRGNKNQYSDFSPNVVLAEQNKFAQAQQHQKNILSHSTYALHLDATLMADYLKKYCLTRGVIHRTAHIHDATVCEKQQITSVILDNKEQLAADFYIDCSGQSALLIGKTLQVSYQNWQHYLPVDSAVVVQSKNPSQRQPYTHAIAHPYGWQWQIPLNNRTGNGYVYCSKYCSDKEALATLTNNITEPLENTPRVIKFTTGKRDVFWHKNCLSIGLSAGFLEPLESTGLYLIMKGMLNFVAMLPDSQFQQARCDEYNRQMDLEFENIRDFIIIHYSLTQRNDSAFWQDWRTRPLPKSLEHKLAVFKSNGILMKNPQDLFSDDSWYAVLEGMKMRPANLNPLVNNSDHQQVDAILQKHIYLLEQMIKQAPRHEAFVNALHNNTQKADS
ncbi:tryptophan 7-halogenase [Pseudoalteromonas sp. S1727]|uniref:tryptophan halogenase family protein n=1 Tax=Pseudoalteromonas sp. S1727 TaxID=2066514 RepID=UPI001107E74C|nr:tryptophan halogenase family protein [Pseudoalteromonas sp. S1727]TMN74114.1 tryptophan 7-halogenase [Pseudoalteromonas sp. S1727]